MFIAAILVSILAALLLYFFLFLWLWRKNKFALLLVSALSPLLTYKAFQYYWYAQAVPAKIELAYPVTAGAESGFREGCSVAVYKLSARSLEEIKKRGLEFFDGVTQARGYTNSSDRHYHYHTYQPWNVTPIPSGWTSEGSMFMCSVISRKLEREIIVAAKQGGAYYTVKDEGLLLVIPSLGYVVFSSYG